MAAAPTAQVAVVAEADAAPGCPGARELASRVNALLGRRALEPAPAPFGGALDAAPAPPGGAFDPASGPPRGPAPGVGAAPTRLEVRLGSDGARHTARVVASGDLRGARELADRGETCEGLAEAVVTSLAFMVESAAAEGAWATPAPAGRPDPWRLEASVGALGTLGLLENARPAAWVEGRAGVGRWASVGLGAGYVVPTSFSRGGADVELGLVFGQAEACARVWTRPVVAVRVCAGGALGGLSGRARGLERSSPRTRPWVAASAGVLASGPSEAGLGWWGRLGAWAPLRQGFTIDGVGAVFEPPAAAVGLGGGLRWSNW